MATSVVNMEASKPPTTSETYENFQPAKVEQEYETHLEKDFPLLKSISQRSVCRTSRLILVLMVFCGVLILSVSILGSQALQFTQSLQGTQEAMQNISQTIQQRVADLKAKRNSTRSRLAELEKTLQQENDKLLKVMKLTQDQLDSLEQNSRALHCEIVEMKSNGSKSGCCPRGWLTFRSSCYWTTPSRDSWPGAKKECEDRGSHLVILNSADENDFVKTHRQGSNSWIGLTDSSGSWKWVDGSAYTVDPKDWAEVQPDHWYSYATGGKEDCAYMMWDGRLNDNVCSHTYAWVCEMELGI